MKKSGSNAGRYLIQGTQGAEIAETAMILPLLFVILLAIFWFGQAFRIYGTITHAAREGARAAVAPACATCTATNSPVQNAVTAVTSAMTAANLNIAQLQPWTTSPAACACGSPNPSCTAGTVPCDSSAATSNMCVQTNIRLSSTTLGGAGTCGTAVSLSYKYPFHFTLPCWPQPCTSIDLNKINLPAQAEMRLETQ